MKVSPAWRASISSMAETVVVGYPDPGSETGFGKVMTITADSLDFHLKIGFVEIPGDDDPSAIETPEDPEDETSEEDID